MQPLLLLEASTLLSGAGNGAVMVVLPWLVLERTGSPGAAGLLAAASALPLFGSSLLSGAIVDSWGRRPTAVSADLMSAASVAAIPLVDLLVGLNLAWLIGLAVVGAVFDPAALNAREAMLPAAAERAGWSLDRANGVHEAVWGVAFMVGPGAGGLLIAWVGADDALWIAACGFLAAAAFESFLVLPHSDDRSDTVSARTILGETAEGLRQVRHDPLLLAMVVMLALVLAAYMPIEEVLLPVHFESLGQPGRLGVVLMGVNGGGVVGALAYGFAASRMRRSTVFRMSLLVGASGVLLMATLPSFPALVVLAFAAGVAYGPIGPLVNIAMQLRSPERMRGRIVGIVVATEYAAGPLGYLIGGAAAEELGVDTTFLAVGVLSVGIGLLGLAVPSLRRLDELDDVVAIEDGSPDPV